MKVLIATDSTQGNRGDDYFFALEGELVYLPIIEHAVLDRCGFAQGFAGVASAKATTTAMVVDRPELTTHDWSVAIADGLTSQGWLEDDWCDANDDLLEQVLADLEAIVDPIAPNTVIERNGTDFFPRHGRLAA